MIKLLLFVLFSATSFAALPPTTSKVSGDSTDIVTFKYRFPNFGGTHSGTTLTLGTLGVAGGGTGLTYLGTANQILGVNSGATANEYKTVSGTSNQVTVTHGAGSITLSTPQDIATTSSPTFSAPVVSSSLKLEDPGAGTNKITFQAPTLGADYTFKMPTANSLGFLYNDGSGNTSYSSSTFSTDVKTKTTTYTITNSDDVILASGSAFTLSLPAVATRTRPVVIKKTDSSLTNIITIDGDGSEVITNNAGSDVTTYTLNTQGEEVTLIPYPSSAPTKWYIQSHTIPEIIVDGGAIGITATTTNPTKGTTSVDKAYWSRCGARHVCIRYEYRQTTTGSAGSGDYLFALPSGLTMDTSFLSVYTTVTGAAAGQVFSNLGYTFYGNTASHSSCAVVPYDSTHVRFACNASTPSAGYVSSGYLSLAGISTQDFGSSFRVPISGWNE